MSRVWVVNASPLILLGKIGHIALLDELSDELIVPDVVAREVSAKLYASDSLIEHALAHLGE